MEVRKTISPSHQLKRQPSIAGLIHSSKAVIRVPDAVQDGMTSTNTKDAASRSTAYTAKRPLRKKKRTRLSDLSGNDNELVRPHPTAVLKSKAELSILLDWKHELLKQSKVYSELFHADASLKSSEASVADRAAAKWKIVLANMTDMLEDLGLEIHVRLECVRAFELRYLSKTTRAAELLTTGTGIEWSEHMKQTPKWLDEAGELVRRRVDDVGTTRGPGQLDHIPAKSMKLIESFGRILLMMESHAAHATGRHRQASIKVEDDVDVAKERERCALREAIEQIQEHVNRVVKQRGEVAGHAASNSTADEAEARAAASTEHDEMCETLAIIEQNVARVFTQCAAPAALRRSAATNPSAASRLKTGPARTNKYFAVAAGSSSSAVTSKSGTATAKHVPAASKLSTSKSAAPASTSQKSVDATVDAVSSNNVTETNVSEYLSPVTTPLSLSTSSSPLSSQDEAAVGDAGMCKKKRTLSSAAETRNKLLNSLLGPVALATTATVAVVKTEENVVVSSTSVCTKVSSNGGNIVVSNVCFGGILQPEIPNNQMPSVGYFLRPPVDMRVAAQPLPVQQPYSSLQPAPARFVPGESCATMFNDNNKAATNYGNESQQQNTNWQPTNENFNGSVGNTSYRQSQGAFIINAQQQPQFQPLLYQPLPVNNNGNYPALVRDASTNFAQAPHMYYQHPQSVAAVDDFGICPPVIDVDDPLLKMSDSDLDNMLVEMTQQNQQDDNYHFQTSSTSYQHQPLYSDNNAMFNSGNVNFFDSESPTPMFNSTVYNGNSVSQTISYALLPPVSSLTNGNATGAPLANAQASVNSGSLVVQQRQLVSSAAGVGAAAGNCYDAGNSMQQLRLRHHHVMQQVRSISSAESGATSSANTVAGVKRPASTSTMINMSRSGAFRVRNERLQTLVDNDDEEVAGEDFNHSRVKSARRYVSGTSVGDELRSYHHSRSGSGRAFNQQHETTPTPVFNISAPPSGKTPPGEFHACSGNNVQQQHQFMPSISADAVLEVLPPQRHEYTPAVVSQQFPVQQLVNLAVSSESYARECQPYYPTPGQGGGNGAVSMVESNNIVFFGGSCNNGDFYNVYSSDQQQHQQQQQQPPVQYYYSGDTNAARNSVSCVSGPLHSQQRKGQEQFSNMPVGPGACSGSDAGSICVDINGMVQRQQQQLPPVIRSSCSATSTIAVNNN